MKKIGLFAMALLAMAGCAKENIAQEENNQANGNHPLLEIGLESTKVALGAEENGKFPVVWSEGDEIAVIDNMGIEGKQNVSIYRLKSGAGSSNGTFEHVSGDAFPDVIKDVVFPASVVLPQSTLLSDIPLIDPTKLVKKEQTQGYAKDNFDPSSPVLYFHNNSDKKAPIVLSPITCVVCIPIKGYDDNDIVTTVKWQHMDGRTVTVTLNCPEGGVKLSQTQATNFYLSIPATIADTDTFNSIVYVYLKNGAIQVQTPRTRKRFEAGTLHRFPEWQLGRKAKWTILGIGSERDASTWKQTPLGPGQYMIDGNELSWWEFRRELKPDNSGPQMAGPHTVVIDLGKVESIKGIKIKSKEIKDSPKYGITNDKGADIYGSQSYNPPHTYKVAFTNEKPSQTVIDAFTKNSTNIVWPTGLSQYTFKDKDDGSTYASINDCYGTDKKTWWVRHLKGENNINTSISARYLFIHFQSSWNNAGTGTAASMMKVAELDIITE